MGGRLSDIDWLLPVTLVVGIELLLWWIAFLAGHAYPPMLKLYGTLAYAVFAVILGCRMFMAVIAMVPSREAKPVQRSLELARDNLPHILVALVALQIFAIGSAAFSALKGAMPRTVPFWLDPPLAKLEMRVFGVHPWQSSHALLGWATPAIDQIYATFVPVQMVALCCLLIASPSPRRGQALVALSLSWLVIGVAGAYLMSSAGPVFYDRAYGGNTFAELTAVLDQGAPIAVKTADILWSSHSANVAVIANGISAMPSMHVGLSLWLALLMGKSAFSPIGWTYFAIIWLGSVHLGWHYVSDGLVASVGALMLWKIAPRAIENLRVMRTNCPLPTKIDSNRISESR